MKRIFSAFLLSILALPVAAVEPAEILTDLALEQRARTISQTLRCLVCRNESIDES
ncbi:MAG: cytochrome c-type biogenesis protein CcmH, partial [Rhodobacterales bacterium]